MLYECMHAKLLQSSLTLCDPMDCSLPGLSVHVIFQARILKWIAMPSSRMYTIYMCVCVCVYVYIYGLPQMVKNTAANAGDVDSIPGLGRSPGGGNGNPLQYSCLENHMDRGARRAIVHSVSKGQTQLSD